MLHWSSRSKTQLSALTVESLGREKYTDGVERKAAFFEQALTAGGGG